jgi:hypothetical protein
MLSVYAKCHCAQFQNAACHYAECHTAKCHNAPCHYAEFHYSECLYVECRELFDLIQTISVYTSKHKQHKTVNFITLIIYYRAACLLSNNLSCHSE